MLDSPFLINLGQIPDYMIALSYAANKPSIRTSTIFEEKALLEVD